MDFSQAYFYISISAACMFFSIVIIVAQHILRVNQIFSRIGWYMLAAGMTTMASGLYRHPALISCSRELLIIQRMLSLAAGFPLLLIIKAINRKFMKKPVLIIIYAILAALILIAAIDLVGDFGWLLVCDPPSVLPGVFFKTVYIPFSYIALTAAFAAIILASRSLGGDSRRIVNILATGMSCMFFSGIFEYLVLSGGYNPQRDTVSLVNPGLLFMSVFVFIFIIEFVKLHIKYKHSGRSCRDSESGKEPDKIDKKIYKRVSDACLDGRLYALGDINIDRLSSETGYPKNVLSRVINRFSGGNFNYFINSFRITEMKKKLEDDDSDETILNIGLEAGFTGKTSINRVFRQFEKMSPREFRERAAAEGEAKNENGIQPACDLPNA